MVLARRIITFSIFYLFCLNLLFAFANELPQSEGFNLPEKSQDVIPTVFKKLKIDFYTRPLWDSMSRSPDISDSRLRVSFAGQSFAVKELLNNFGLIEAKPISLEETTWTVTAEFSAAGLAMRNPVKKQLADTTKQRLNVLRPAMQYQVYQYLLKNNPLFGSLPPALQQQKVNALTDHLYQTTYNELTEHQSEVVDEVVPTTTFQELSISLAGPIGSSKNMVYFLYAGKIKPPFGAPVDQNKETELERIRAGRDVTQRITSAFATTGVDLGTTYRSEGNFALTGELVIFHDRIPWISAQQYIATLVNLPRNMYDEQDQLADLNSGLFRINFDTHIIDSYIAIGSFNGSTAGTVGAIIKISPRDRLYVDYSQGNRPFVAERGFQITFAHNTKLFEIPITIFGGLENLKNMPDYAYYFEPVDAKNIFAGLRLMVWKGKIFSAPSKVGLGLEVIQQDVTTHSPFDRNPDTWDFRTSLDVSVDLHR